MADNENDINKQSAERTDEAPDAPNPAGPANPTPLGEPGNEGIASTDEDEDETFGD